MHELWPLMTSISDLIRCVVFFISRTHTQGRWQSATGILWGSDFSDFSDSRTLTDCPSPPPLQINSIFPSFHISLLYAIFPSHLACLSISLLIPVGLEAFLLCLLSLVCIWEQTSTCAVILQTYLGLNISLNVMLPRHEIYRQRAARSWTHTVRHKKKVGFFSSVCLMGFYLLFIKQHKCMLTHRVQTSRNTRASCVILPVLCILWVILSVYPSLSKLCQRNTFSYFLIFFQ